MSFRTPATRRRAVEILFAVLLIGLLLYRFGPELRSQAGLPARAPDLQLTTLSGDTLRLADLGGSVILVNFWATWCAPCRVEMPMLQDVWEDYRDRGFTVLGLYTDTGPIIDLASWFRGAGITYPLARATPAAIRGFGQGTVLPTSFLIDQDGRVVERVQGIYPESALRSVLDRLLGPATATGPAPDAADARLNRSAPPPATASGAAGR